MEVGETLSGKEGVRSSGRTGRVGRDTESRSSVEGPEGTQGVGVVCVARRRVK